MIDALREYLPPWLIDALPWLGLASLAMFVLTPMAAAWVIIRMPVDYFTRAAPPPPRHPVGRVVAKVLGMLLGVLLILAGVAMLVLPGQGLLTILIGLMLTGLPGRRRIEQRVVRRAGVRRALNAIRRRAARPPLEFPA
ncbi:MAG: hypothetical protein AAF628_16935 [Planctomycetota bacterium]